MSRKFILITLFLALGSLWSFTEVQAATFGFDPSNITVIAGCEYSADLYANASGESSNAAEVEITYNPAVITVIDVDPDVVGTQVDTGDAYEAYFLNEVNEGLGRIRLVSGSYTSLLTSNKLFAQIRFTANSSGAASFTINFTGVGATYDSNIASSSTSNDLLTSVTNGSVTISAGSCPADTLSPSVTFVSPTSEQQAVPLNANVQLRIVDNGSGVDLSSLIIQLNDIIYTASSPGVNITGSAADYTITIDPSIDFPANTPIVVQVAGSDIDGNNFADIIVFNGTISTGEPVEVDPGDDVACDCGGPSVVTVTETIIRTLIENSGQDVFEGTPLENTVIDNVVQNIGATGTGALVTGIALGLNFLPFVALLNAPGLILNILGVILGRQRARPWGLVIDAVTSKPIAFATCRLYIAGTASRINQTVSDTQGRYGFVISPGSYRLEVSQSGYENFSREIKLEEGEQSYVYDVQLTPRGAQALAENTQMISGYSKRIGELWSELWKSLTRILIILGLTLAVVSAIYLPNIFNWAILAAYLIVLSLITISKLNLRPKYAAVIDSATLLRIPYATIKFFDPNSKQLVDTQTTNQQGQFDFWGVPGKYAILVACRGYKFPSQRQTDYEKTAGYQGMLLVNLTKGGNRIQLFVDPLTGQLNTQLSTSGSTTGNLASPFDE